MSVVHFENGTRTDIQRVDASVKVENLARAVKLDTSWIKTFTVPAGKKWNIFQIGASCDISRDIVFYLTDPATSQVSIQNGTGIDHLYLDSNFSITGGWEITFHFYMVANGTMTAFILYSEEDEY